MGCIHAIHHAADFRRKLDLERSQVLVHVKQPGLEAIEQRLQLRYGSLALHEILFSGLGVLLVYRRAAGEGRVSPPLQHVTYNLHVCLARHVGQQHAHIIDDLLLVRCAIGLGYLLNLQGSVVVNLEEMVTHLVQVGRPVCLGQHADRVQVGDVLAAALLE